MESLHQKLVTVAGATDLDQVLRAAVTAAIKKSAKSRLQIADEMSLSLGAPITERMLNSFTAESKEKHRFPLAWAVAFCQSAGDWSPLRLVVERAGFRLIDESQVEVLELGQQLLDMRASQLEIDARVDQLVTSAKRGRR